MSTSAVDPAAGTGTGAGAGRNTTDPGPRRAYRPVEHRVLAGVAAGLAEHLGVQALWVRVTLVVSCLFGGVGILVYAGLWRFLPQSLPADGEAVDPVPRGRATAQTLALVVLGVGLLLLQQQLGFGPPAAVTWPLLLAVGGIALVWQQADEAQRRRLTHGAPEAPLVGALLGVGGRAGLARMVVGVLAVALAAGLLAVGSAGLSSVLPVLSAIVLAVLGLVLVLGPWISRLARDLAAERRERVRTQERADVAAHLHDSVLQTLALLQRHADDPTAVTRLARRQERELRSWLYDEADAAVASLSASLTARLAALAGEVEERFDVTVEVVSVGDTEVDDRVAALVAATGEAVVNAAKHSGAGHVDVYAEAGPDGAEVFVRDRGRGFEPAEVPDDRLGVRGSIMERMRRHGGTASVRSAPGEGTEVRLVVTR